MQRLLPLLAFAFLAAAPASAELVIRDVTWQLAPGRAEAGKPRGFKPIERWVQPPTARLSAKPRALITVANRGPNAVDGMVLRYALSARLVKTTGPVAAGVWAVPFYLNERRVPRVGPNQVKEIPLNDLVLDVFLKKSYRAGYWPDALKIQVMVEPRAGEGLEQRILEDTLPVTEK